MDNQPEDEYGTPVEQRYQTRLPRRNTEPDLGTRSGASRAASAASAAPKSRVLNTQVVKTKEEPDSSPRVGKPPTTTTSRLSFSGISRPLEEKGLTREGTEHLVGASNPAEPASTSSFNLDTVLSGAAAASSKVVASAQAGISNALSRASSTLQVPSGTGVGPSGLTGLGPSGSSGLGPSGSLGLGPSGPSGIGLSRPTGDSPSGLGSHGKYPALQHILQGKVGTMVAAQDEHDWLLEVEDNTYILNPNCVCPENWKQIDSIGLSMCKVHILRNPAWIMELYRGAIYRKDTVKAMRVPTIPDIDKLLSHTTRREAFKELFVAAHEYRTKYGVFVGDVNFRVDLTAKIKRNSRFAKVADFLDVTRANVNANQVLNILVDCTADVQTVDIQDDLDFIKTCAVFIPGTKDELQHECHMFLFCMYNCFEAGTLSNNDSTWRRMTRVKFQHYDLESIMKKEEIADYQELIQFLTRFPEKIKARPGSPRKSIAAESTAAVNAKEEKDTMVRRVGEDESESKPSPNKKKKKKGGSTSQGDSPASPTGTDRLPKWKAFQMFQQQLMNNGLCISCGSKSCRRNCNKADLKCDHCGNAGHTKLVCFTLSRVGNSMAMNRRVSAFEELLTIASNTEEILPNDDVVKVVEPLICRRADRDTQPDIILDTGADDDLINSSIADLYGYDWRVDPNASPVVSLNLTPLSGERARNEPVKRCSIMMKGTDVYGLERTVVLNPRVEHYQMNEIVLNCSVESTELGVGGKAVLQGYTFPLLPLKHKSRIFRFSSLELVYPSLSQQVNRRQVTTGSTPTLTWSDLRLTGSSDETNIATIHHYLAHPTAKYTRLTLKEQGMELPESNFEHLKDCSVCEETRLRISHPDSLTSTRVRKAKHADLSTPQYYSTTWVVDTVKVGASYNATYGAVTAVHRGSNFWVIRPFGYHDEVSDIVGHILLSDPTATAVQTDNGLEFNTLAWKNMIRGRGVAHLTSAPYSPATNGLAEVANKHLKEMVFRTARVLNISVKYWPLFLEACAEAHNATASDQGSPFLRRFGMPPSVKLLPGHPVTFKLLDGEIRRGCYLSSLHHGASLVLEVTPTKYTRRTIYPGRVRPASLNANGGVGDREDSVSQLELGFCTADKNELIVLRPEELTPDNIEVVDADYSEPLTPDTPDTPVTMVTSTTDFSVPGWGLVKGQIWRYFTDGVLRNTTQGKEADGKVVRTKKQDITAYIPGSFDSPPPVIRRNEVMVIQQGTTHRPANSHERRSKEMEQARRDELQKFVDMKVLQACERPETKPIPTMFFLTMKRKGETLVPKARFVCRGDLDSRNPLSYVELPSTATRRLTLIYGISKGWRLAVADITNAFLNAPMEGNVVVHISDVPTNSPLSPGYYKLRRTMYGLKEAPRIFVKYLEQQLLSKGYTQIAPGLFLKGDGSTIISPYVDDLTCLSDDPKERLADLGLCYGSLDEINDQVVTSVGWDISMQDRALRLSMNTYLMVLPSYSKTHLTAQSFVFVEGDQLVDSEQHEHYRKGVGQLLWLSTMYHQVAFMASALSSVVAKPSVKALETLNIVLSKCRSLPAIKVQPLDLATTEVVIYADASYNHTSRTARIAWILLLQDANGKSNAVSWRSFVDRRYHSSTASAELAAATHAILNNGFFVESLRSLLSNDTKVTLLSDNQALLGQFDNRKAADFQCQGRLNLCIQAMELLNVTYRYVSTQDQLADRLTKYMPL